jgi:hypothetical protein
MNKITPEWLDKWRIWPRMIITLYGIAFYETTTWFMSLPDPTNAQAGFVSVIVGAGAGFFGIYVNGRVTTQTNDQTSTSNSNRVDDR